MAFWAERIELKDIFHNEDLTFEQRRDAIVKRLQESSWYKMSCDDHPDMQELIDNDLAMAEDTDEFDVAWDILYDYADTDRVWINTLL